MDCPCLRSGCLANHRLRLGSRSSLAETRMELWRSHRLMRSTALARLTSHDKELQHFLLGTRERGPVRNGHGWLGRHAILCASSARTSLRTAATRQLGGGRSPRERCSPSREGEGGRCPTRARGRARTFEGFLCQKAAPGGVSPPKQQWAILSRACLFQSPALPSQSHSVETSITGAYVKAADSTRAARASSVALSHCPLCAH